MPSTSRATALAGLAFVVAAPPAAASFHFMQIEQVVAGVCGNTAYQAVQLRMRGAGQDLVAGKPIKVWDAQGMNPITLVTFPANVANDGTGVRILATTPALAAAFGITPDAMLTQTIPDSYLAAGRVTWEDGFGTIYWSLAWGGASYTGSNAGDTTNDLDGNFGPPFSSPLPYNRATGVLFTGPASAASTFNQFDYMLTGSPATLTNNAGVAVTLPVCLFGDGFLSGDLSAWSGDTSSP